MAEQLLSDSAAPHNGGFPGSGQAPHDAGLFSTTLKSALRTPAFIVGSPRSGTSILVNGLLAGGYNGYREGNFLTLLRVIEIAADRHRATFGPPSPKVLAGSVNWDHLKADLFDVLKLHVDALNPVSPWLDKTGNPEMIEAIPLLVRLWPGAGFIFAKRRAIENVASRLKKFPEHGFEYHCRDWARNMAAWRLVRNELGDRCVEIDQQDIARAPGEVAGKLAAFLGAGVEAQERMKRTFTRDRPQETEAGSSARIMNLQDTGWTTQQREIFLRLCGPELEHYGYRLDAAYSTAA
jgi:hypothetical protein